MKNFLDNLIIEFDKGIKSSLSNVKEHQRAYPAESTEEVELNEFEKNHSAGLMRVNQAGEVCAQALYRGQSLTAELKITQDQLKEAAEEEMDHLAWCNRRLNELGDKPSVLNPLWYFMSFSIGALTGLAGDKWSLGFVEETERQVVAHLDSHLDEISDNDKKTKTVINKMRDDEDAHARRAKESGASELPNEIKTGMSWVARLMTSTSYYI
jgi:ubiquinone biosynthesis monooxygenase Coq7